MSNPVPDCPLCHNTGWRHVTRNGYECSEPCDHKPQAPEFHPFNHRYTTHATYTGPGCAICGRPPADHQQQPQTPDAKERAAGEERES